MAKCQLHEATFKPVLDDVKQLKIDTKSIGTEVTIMRTQMSDVSRGITIGATTLGILQILATILLFIFKH